VAPLACGKLKRDIAMAKRAVIFAVFRRQT